MFATYTGKLIDFTNIKPEDICLEDIAHHLSRIQRYGGALPFSKSYNVAKHSLYLTYYFYLNDQPEGAKCALLHDATEAYLGDIVTGLKHLLKDYQALEQHLETIIFDKYGIKKNYKEMVKEADKRILIDEVKALKPEQLHLFVEQEVEPLGINISSDTHPHQTKARFLNWCTILGIED